MSVILTHCSKTEITKVREVDQDPTDLFKPKGFWYSVNDEWEEYCNSEVSWWDEYKFLYTLTLGNERMLKLRDRNEITRFNQQFAGRDGFILWFRVAEEYDGIEIAPYCWALRNHYLWYYSWDVASGCIWRPKGLVLRTKEAR